MTRYTCFALASSFVFAACSSDTTPGPMGGGTADKTIQSIALTFDADKVPLGRTLAWSVTATYDDGTTGDITADVDWNSSNTNVARVSPQEDQPGLVLSVGEGRAIISAIKGEKSANQWITVDPPAVRTIEIDAATFTRGIGKNIKMNVTALNTDDTERDVTNDVTWESSNPTVGIMSATDKGELVTLARGTTEVTATLGDSTTSQTFTVVDATVDRMTVAAPSTRVELGGSIVLSANAVYTNSENQNVTALASWSSSAPNFITVNGQGVVTGVAAGDATITATLDGVTATIDLRAYDPGQCNYPPDAPDSITYGAALPNLYWEGAFLNGANVDLRMGQFHCSDQYSQYETIAFVIGAGWCPNCPPFMRQIADQADALEEAGMLVVYVEIETSGGAPATNAQSNSIVSREIMNDTFGARVGSKDTKPLDRPFARAVRAVPMAYVVRKSDMVVIADQSKPGGRLNFLAIAQDPNRFHSGTP